eukprot:13899466-Ditylum_brightwellii.AAC.1
MDTELHGKNQVVSNNKNNKNEESKNKSIKLGIEATGENNNSAGELKIGIEVPAPEFDLGDPIDQPPDIIDPDTE